MSRRRHEQSRQNNPGAPLRGELMAMNVRAARSGTGSSPFLFKQENPGLCPRLVFFFFR